MVVIIMDIKNVTNSLVGNRPDNTTQAGRGGSQSATQSAQQADSVTLSASVQDLEQKAQAASVDNKDRINQLKQAIQDGSYQIDADKIASKLIETETLFSGV